MFLWFLLGGLGHFLAAPFFVAIVPPWVPWSAPHVVWLSGAAELLGAAALLSSRLRPAAGIGLLILIVCVTPANIYMLQHAERFPQFPLWLLWLRLPVQAALMLCVAWSTRPDQGRNSPSR